jgi:hypothetical protein
MIEISQAKAYTDGNNGVIVIRERKYYIVLALDYTLKVKDFSDVVIKGNNILINADNKLWLNGKVIVRDSNIDKCVIASDNILVYQTNTLGIGYITNVVFLGKKKRIYKIFGRLEKVTTGKELAMVEVWFDNLIQLWKIQKDKQFIARGEKFEVFVNSKDEYGFIMKLVNLVFININGREQGPYQKAKLTLKGDEFIISNIVERRAIW